MRRAILSLTISTALAGTGCRMTSNMALPSSLAQYDRTPSIAYEEAGELNASRVGFWFFSIPISTPSADAVVNEKVPPGWAVENLDIDSTYTMYFWPFDFPSVRVRGTLLKPK